MGSLSADTHHGSVATRHNSYRRIKMAWKTPKISEVQVGMEISMYACAKRK